MKSIPQKTDIAHTASPETWINKKCCVSQNSIKVAKLQSNEADFTLNENDKKIEIDDEEYYYYAIEIPNIKGEVKYKLSSFFSGKEETKNIALPIVWVLDHQFNVTRKSEIGMIEYRPWSIWNQEEFYLYLRTDRGRFPSEKYLLITSDSKSIGKRLVFKQNSKTIYMPVMAGNNVVGFAPQAEGGEKFSFNSNQIGKFHLELITNPMSKPFDRFIYF
jgi:hypothetical protein